MPHKTYTLSLSKGCDFKVNAIIHPLPDDNYEVSHLPGGNSLRRGVYRSQEKNIFPDFVLNEDTCDIGLNKVHNDVL